ncbi:MAG TPA: ScyD/ScyE family protein [Solirubrobacteraceae bacterium]|jgi:hypothetical protein|nr:ScyD/ScyE family protein [Solirubrobacteraceae bacterium]
MRTEVPPSNSIMGMTRRACDACSRAIRESRILHRLALMAALAAATTGAAGVAATAPAGARQLSGGHGNFGRGDGLSGSHGPRHHGHGQHFGPPPAPEGVQPIVTGLNQPKKLTVAPDGSLLVALSGDGAATTDCTTGEEPSCLDESGAIDRVTPGGQVKTLIQGLPSVSSEGEATGPAEARYMHGGLEVLFQDTNIDPTTGEEPYGPAGRLLGDLVRFPIFFGFPHIQASFGPFEAHNNPDGGEGTAIEIGAESAIDSDPYSFVPYRGGIVVADAAGDDLLFVSPSGAISVLAVLPTIAEIAAPGTLGPGQTTPVEIQAQPVPDSVAVGPDGALYVGELGGAPFGVGASSVYRVVPGHAPTVYASGFTAIGDIAFDPRGRLLVLEIDQQGLNDPALAAGELPTPGAIIGVHRNGAQALLASTGLEFSTGMAVTPQGAVYVSNYGVLPASGGPGGLSGQVDRVGLASSWTQTPW